jgi:alkylation response protein AidB-like acyl-CoA dehydrogenase
MSDASSTTVPLDLPGEVPAMPGMLAMQWPGNGKDDDGWLTADRFARGRAPNHAEPAKAGPSKKTATSSWLDSMHGLGWASLCANQARGGQGAGMGVLCRVLEAVAAVDATAACAVYAGAAAHIALNLCGLPAEREALLRDLSVDWLAWPAFHDIDEQLWPAMDAQGYLRGQVDLLLCGTHARWVVMPAQLKDQGIGLVLVDLSHPAAMRGTAVETLGLTGSGIADVEFGGVPCEVLNPQGREVFEQVAMRLAPAVMALLCGVSRASARDAHAHAAERRQGGGSLMGWGEVRRMLSSMHERLRVMQGLLASALMMPVGAMPKGVSSPAHDARYAALHAGDLAAALTSDGLQLLGGAGYMSTHPQATRLRDARQLKGLMGGVAWRRQRLLEQTLADRAV